MRTAAIAVVRGRLCRWLLLRCSSAYGTAVVYPTIVVLVWLGFCFRFAFVSANMLGLCVTERQDRGNIVSHMYTAVLAVLLAAFMWMAAVTLLFS